MSTPDTIRILGIDPGTASTGFGVIDRIGTKYVPVWYDCLRTKSSKTLAARLVTISDAVSTIVERFEPSHLAIEELFFGANAQAALSVGHARGVCIAVCASAGVEVFEYSNNAIKQAVTGHGRADKQQVMEMVKHQLNMTEIPKPDHAADALAAAITHASTLSSRRRYDIALQR